jgi:transposase
MQRGRKKKLSDEEKDMIDEALERDSTFNCEEILEATNLDCNTRTIYRYLMSQGYLWKPIFDTFLLLQRHKDARVRFARSHQNES